MLDVFKSLLGSKKFVALLVGLLALIGTKVGLEPEAANEIGTKIMAMVSAYLLGQGLADSGKEAAKETAKQPSHSVGTFTTNGTGEGA